ncbi:MAG TPA: CbtB-domain containing protein [Acidimicrobiales bacterium]|jgi:hypothetical protein|nr:CbtB-domain containing protein [Acidimicrobiales bacterium]
MAADTTTTAAADPSVVVAPIPGWALVALLAVAALTLWLVTFDNGQITSVLSRGDLFIHEFFHDGRHLLGVPCH